MSGLLFLALVLVWLVLAIGLTRWSMRRIRITSGLARMTLGLILLSVIFLFPVADEIIGGTQFRKLCRENAVLRIDVEKAKGRIVREVFDPSNEILPGTAIPILHTRKSYRDLATGEEIASEDRYVAKGGWFIRILGISEKNAPIIIGRSGCSPPLGGRAVAKQYSFMLNE